MAISIQPVHPVIGAEIKAVGLSKPVDGETVAGIRNGFEGHVVVVFRGLWSSLSSSLRRSVAATRRKSRTTCERSCHW